MALLNKFSKAPSFTLVPNTNNSYIPKNYQYLSDSKLLFSNNKKPLIYRRLRLPNSSIHVLLSNNDDSGQNVPVEEDEVDNIGVKAALSIIKLYKNEISPLLPKSCRYIPTCSDYAIIAYKKYGFVKGSVLTGWRICRCNPLGGTGFDPPRWFGESDKLDN